jgi:UDP-N-acetylglucosamine--N-acetylmuramyl-(pentapeptide) pyrophosphoryl-undecaprenol N-acetylglucosamine transferase
MKFLIVAAKTGGHVFPAASIAKGLIKKDHKVVFLGTGAQIEKNAFKDISSTSFNLSIEGFRGNSVIKKCKVLFQVLINVFKILRIINKEKIDGMVGFGGFITVPAGLAFWIKGKPIFLHEQNAVLGTANKLLSKLAKINFLGFPIKGIKKSILSGNPIRDSFSVIQSVNNNEGLTKIYITGGSQGAEYINKELPSMFKDLPYNIKIRHQCGQNNIEMVKNEYLSNNINAEVNDFYESPEEQISWSDFVISRGGALTLSEITSVNRGVLIIPLPTSIDNHQIANAKIIEKMNMGMVHYQNESIENLKQKISSIIENKTFRNWKKFNNETNLNATSTIVAHIEEYFKINETV